MNAITIVGGGLAGLTLGIGLRQRAVPVTVFEAGNYPRHRVCGEFISGKGLESVKRLGLLPALINAGARDVRTVAFYSARRCYMRRVLPEAGLAIARRALDSALAGELKRLGGDLRVESRWDGDYGAPGVVRATGRRRAAPDSESRWFGVKAHVKNVSLECDLEMHFLEHGYIGLCRLSDGTSNVCGMFSAGGKRGHVRELLDGPAGSIIHERLRGAVWLPDSFCAVAGLPLHAGIDRSAEARVGDAIAMVPPATGNGMSFAFESAAMASRVLCNDAVDGEAWGRLVGQLQAEYRAGFSQRLFWANKLHRILLGSHEIGLWLGCGNAAAWKFCFNITR